MHAVLPCHLYPHRLFCTVWLALLAPDMLRHAQEIEAAVHNKLLPATFRTSLCSTALTDGVACPLGERCFNAHSLDELRVNAAINLKLLPMDYKLTLCEAYCNSGAHLLVESSCGSCAMIPCALTVVSFSLPHREVRARSPVQRGAWGA